LTTFVVPDTVTRIGDGAFLGCTVLDSVVFAGDAPGEFGLLPFVYGPRDLVIYYFSGSSGFTSPTWNDYTAVEIDSSLYPTAIWLLEHDMPYDTDMTQDLNGDGVQVLAAYALDLDPRRDLRGSVPVPIWSESGLTVTFRGSSVGVTYGAESSDGLAGWSADGITLSEPDAEGRRSAILRPSGDQRFMRLVFSQ
jgi:hypothetical protein